MNRWSKDNRDHNEPLITSILDHWHVEFGYGNKGDGYDLILYTQPIVLVEVKNPEQKWKLTDAETHRREYCKARGIPFYVVEYSDQMSDILSAHFQQGGK